MEFKKIKNKKYLIPAIALLLLTFASAIIILEDGTRIVNREEMASVTDQQIQNYMTNNFKNAE